MVPNFMVIGQAKCGTTSICEALAHHPAVFVTDPKETHFYCFENPKLTREWYESLFRHANAAVAVGEGSTSYTRPDVHRECAERIHREIPDVRLVYLARDPIVRVESDWKMKVREGEAPWNDINRCLDDHRHVVELGRYWRNTSAYRERFPADQLLMLTLEDFSRSPEETLRRIFRHLGVDERPASEEDISAKNAAEAQRKDGALMALARRAGLIDAARAMLPSRMVTSLKAALTTDYRYEANWDPGRLADLQAMYREESLPFLAACGKSPDFWSYEPRESVRRRAGDSGRG